MIGKIVQIIYNHGFQVKIMDEDVIVMIYETSETEINIKEKYIVFSALYTYSLKQLNTIKEIIEVLNENKM